jgi:RNase H-like domain found in reverse transcriptase/Reverse transcriptase (RNA-dependent DNA polymerase)
MDKVLAEHLGKFVLVYLDDLTIYSKTFEDHVTHLSLIFQTLRKAQLKLNKDKCHFFLPSIKFLGHEISRQGIQPDEDKLIKVKEFPRPINLRTLRRFLGLASYYRKFIKDFSKRAKPLNQLLQKDEPFDWKAEQQQAFEWLKHQLITAPILRYPNFKKTFYLHTDASGTGLGAVLAQKDEDNKEYAVAYASRSLNKAERNYSTTEQECLAVIWAVEHFRHYFGTTHFFVVTDHAALKWLGTTELKGRRARWILRLEPYNFTILHRAGRKHNNADSLSRLEI